ncbi:MAG: hypothetical protein CENE_00494 [Candidatus Celerinatantimonas neptuna]|nr:MAG: hypothetical protein CENE_00494 [Candidatus Celerinatantimonas neptuna]
MPQSNVIIYGISNCDTIKKACRWLDEQQINYQLHDYRKNGLTQTMLEEFECQLGWEKLLNKRSTTYRQLDETQKEALNRQNVLNLLEKYPTLIKRPLLVFKDHYLIGFKPELYHQFFSQFQS